MSDHGARALTVAAIGLVVVGVGMWWLAGRATGVETIAEAVATAEPGEEIRIRDLVEQDWQALHVFAPYTPPEVVEVEVGQRVGEVRGLLRDEVMLIVLAGGDGRVVASGLVARAPVDWLPAVRNRPYDREDAVFRVEMGDDGPVLHPAGGDADG